MPSRTGMRTLHKRGRMAQSADWQFSGSTGCGTEEKHKQTPARLITLRESLCLALCRDPHRLPDADAELDLYTYCLSSVPFSLSSLWPSAGARARPRHSPIGSHIPKLWVAAPTAVPIAIPMHKPIGRPFELLFFLPLLLLSFTRKHLLQITVSYHSCSTRSFSSASFLP